VWVPHHGTDTSLAVSLCWSKGDHITCHPSNVRESWQAPLQQTLLAASGGASWAPQLCPTRNRWESSLASCLQTTLKLNVHLTLLSLWTKSCGSQLPQSLVLLFLHRKCTAHSDFRGIPPQSRLQLHELKIHLHVKISFGRRDKMSLIFIKNIFMIFLMCSFYLLAKYTTRLK